MGFPKLFLFCKKKTRMSFLKQWLLILALIFPTLIFSQTFSPNLNLSDTSQVHVLTTNRGDIFIGRVIEIIDTRVSFLAKGDISIEFQFSEIQKIDVKGEEIYPKSENYEEQPVFPNRRSQEPFNTQLMFLTPTAFTLDRGKTLYSNVDVLWNSLDVGVTDHFQVGFGVVLPFIAIPRAKFAIDLTEKVHVGAGVNAFTVIDFYYWELNMALHPYAVTTFGNPDLFINITGGYILPLGYIEERVMVAGLGVGGESEKFVYKGELLIYQEPVWNGMRYTRLFPELGFGIKARNKRFELGIVGLAVFDFPLFPYLSFKTHF